MISLKYCVELRDVLPIFRHQILSLSVQLDRCVFGLSVARFSFDPLRAARTLIQHKKIK